MPVTQFTVVDTASVWVEGLASRLCINLAAPISDIVLEADTLLWFVRVNEINKSITPPRGSQRRRLSGRSTDLVGHVTGFIGVPHDAPNQPRGSFGYFVSKKRYLIKFIHTTVQVRTCRLWYDELVGVFGISLITRF